MDRRSLCLNEDGSLRGGIRSDDDCNAARERHPIFHSQLIDEYDRYTNNTNRYRDYLLGRDSFIRQKDPSEQQAEHGDRCLQNGREAG